MEIVSLHPIDAEAVQRFVAVLQGAPPDPAWVGWSPEALRDDVARAGAGDEMAANRITRGLAIALGQSGPFFTHRAFGLSFWEAQVDRPIGMLMRPPARLFMDAGLDTTVARTMPIRLDFQHGMMGGAYIPARLIDQAYQLLDDHMERSVKRLVAAEYDPVATLGIMWEAVSYARDRGMGLYEAMDVVGPDGQGLPGMTMYSPDRKRLDIDLVARIDEYRKPPKKPGLLQRMFGRGASNANANGHIPEGDG
jgi:hypothetical protein